jgi:hypothetical protein
MRISGSISGRGGFRESFDGFLTVHTHIEPAGTTSVREIEKSSLSMDVSASNKCWPGLMVKSILTSAEGTVALVTPSIENVIGQLEALITLTVVSRDGCGAHCALAKVAAVKQRHTTTQSRAIVIRFLMVHLPVR